MTDLVAQISKNMTCWNLLGQIEGIPCPRIGRKRAPATCRVRQRAEVGSAADGQAYPSRNAGVAEGRHLAAIDTPGKGILIRNVGAGEETELGEF